MVKDHNVNSASLKLAFCPVTFSSMCKSVLTVTVAEVIMCVHIHSVNQNGLSEGPSVT